jgi:hypothetical protein
MLPSAFYSDLQAVGKDCGTTFYQAFGLSR